MIFADTWYASYIYGFVENYERALTTTPGRIRALPSRLGPEESGDLDGSQRRGGQDRGALGPSLTS